MNPLEECKPVGDWIETAPWRDRSVSLLVPSLNVQASTLAGKRLVLQPARETYALWTGKYRTEARLVMETDVEAIRERLA